MLFSPLTDSYGQVPKLKGSDLVINGESFFAASNIASELTRLARADGVLPANESFKQIAVSGASISQIMGFYKSCNPKPKYLISDGGGIDLMYGNCSNSECSTIKTCKNTLLQYLDEIKKGGTKKLIWMIYPDPQNAQWANLKKNQDIWAEVVPPIINGLTEPKGMTVDMRPVWAGKYNQYTSDGIHCTDAGGKASAEAFWKAIKANNWAFFDTNTTSSKHSMQTSAPSCAILSKVIQNRNLDVAISLDHPEDVTLQLTTISGRTVLSAKQKTITAGNQTVNFSLGSLSKGLYCCVIRAGKITSKSTIVVP